MECFMPSFKNKLFTLGLFTTIAVGMFACGVNSTDPTPVKPQQGKLIVYNDTLVINDPIEWGVTTAILDPSSAESYIVFPSGFKVGSFVVQSALSDLEAKAFQFKNLTVENVEVLSKEQDPTNQYKTLFHAAAKKPIEIIVTNPDSKVFKKGDIIVAKDGSNNTEQHNIVAYKFHITDMTGSLKEGAAPIENQIANFGKPDVHRTKPFTLIQL